MSLLEVVAAIAILAIFGTSLFLMQQYLFDRMMVAQTKLTAHLRMQAELVQYQKNIVKEQFEHDGVVEKSLQPIVKNFKSPDMVMTIKAQSNIAGKPDGITDQEFSEQEFSFNKFADVHLITVKSEQQGKDLGALYLFVYVPKVKT